MELPGASVPPSMRVSPTTPLPPSVPPAFTVVSDDEAMEPFTDNVPPLIVVAPVKVLRPSRICVPAPALVSDSSPAGPLISCPENVLLPPEGAMVSVAGAPSASDTSPLPDSERIVLLRPASISPPLTTKSDEAENAVVDPASAFAPASMVVDPV